MTDGLSVPTTSDDAQSVLEAACRYKKLGWEVVPLPERRKAPVPGEKALGFKVTGKSHNQIGEAALDDYVTARRWTSRDTGEVLPYRNLGLVMPTGFVGLDVDAYDEKLGGESFTRLNELCGGLPATYRTSSRDDGVSGIYMFRCEQADELRDIPGIEIIRPSHRYAIVEPSIHPNGSAYRWLLDDGPVSHLLEMGGLPALPPSVAHYLSGGALPLEPRTSETATPTRVEKFITSLRTDGATASRHSMMRDFQAHLVATGQDNEAMIGLLREVWSQHLPDRLDDFERSLDGARAKFGEPDPPGPPAISSALADSRLDLGDLLANGAPEPEWLIEPFIPAKRTTLLVAGAKTGKSLLLGEAAVSAALGRTWLGATPDKPIRVLYLDYEMTPDDLAERLESMGLSPKDDPQLAENLFYYQHPVMRPLDTAEGAKDLHGLVDLHRPKLVIIDTWSRVISGNENDSESYTAFYRLTNSPLKAKGIAVVMADHTGHENKKRSRGSSAKLDLVDLAWTLRATDSGIRLQRQAQRISWAPEEISLTRTEDGAPIHKRTSKGWPEGTRGCVDLLDRLEVPVELGERKARLAVRDAGGVAPRAEILRAAIKFRKQQFDLAILVGDAPSDAPV